MADRTLATMQRLRHKLHDDGESLAGYAMDLAITYYIGGDPILVAQSKEFLAAAEMNLPACQG